MPGSPDPDAAARQKALALLGLPPGAGKAEVRQAYRRLALRCHPDLHPGDPGMARRFQALSEAYSLLLTVGTGEPPAAPLPPPPMPRRGGDLQFRLRLDFLQAARGGEFPVTEAAARSTLALPFHGRMREAEVDTVCRALARAIEEGL